MPKKRKRLDAALPADLRKIARKAPAGVQKDHLVGVIEEADRIAVEIERLAFTREQTIRRAAGLALTLCAPESADRKMVVALMEQCDG